MVNFVYSLLIVRLLGAPGFGEYSIFNNSLAFFILLFGFNLPSVMVFFIANRRVEPGKLLLSSIIFTIITGLGIGLLLMGSDRLGLAIHVFPGGQNKGTWILLFVLLFFFLQINQLLTAFLNAHKIFIPVSIFVLVMNILLLLFWLLFSLNIFETQMALFDFVWWINVAFNASMTIYFFYLIMKRVPGRLSLKLIGRSELRLLAGFTVIVYLCNTLQFLNYKMDVWFIHYFSSNTETGIYALALSLSQLIWILPNAVSGVLLNYYQVNKREDSIELAMHYGNLSVYLSFFTALVLLVIFYFALPVVYGPQFTRVFGLCAVLFVGTVPFSLAIVIANLNSGIGYVRVNLYATLFTFLLGFGLDYLLIPSYGVTGAVIAKLTIYLLGLLFHMAVGQFLYKLPWTRLFKWPDFRNLLRKDLISL